MMKRIYIICVLALLGFSCEKNLDLTPEDVLTESSFFLSANDFRLFANNFYDALPNQSQGLSDRQTDIGYTEGGNDVSRGTHQAPQNSSTWDGAYANIRKYNFLLEKIEEADENLQVEVEAFKGESLFFRAYTYFTLLKTYGGVPIITQTLDTDSEDLQKSRDSRQDVVARIVQDLDMAISLLPTSNTGSDVGRVSSYAALAFKARVALFEGTWRKFHGLADVNTMLDQAMAAADQVIQNGGFELFDRRDVLGDDSYRYYFLLDGDGRTNPAGITKAEDKEAILVRRQDRDLKSTGNPFPLVDVRQQNPTKSMMDLYLCNDGLPIDKSPNFMGYDNTDSEYQNRDPRLGHMMVPDQRYWSFQFAEWWKNWANPTANGFVYMEDGDDWGGRTATGYQGTKMTPEVEQPFGIEFAVIRYAEVLLIYAEAAFERNGSISDQDLDKSINKLRDRVGMPHLTNTFVNTNNLDMQTEIRRERTVELAFEGFRYDDLRRWKTAETVLPQPIKGIKFDGTQWSIDPRYSSNNFTTDANGFVIVESIRTFDPQKHYLMPLPIRQLILNPNLEQNPGWPEQ
ncbi:RagB/SusD family nutrient uptake outer membrane protein [Reichenbachiella sp. MALMAid0571]|uniref:RagB/SusD family nutrient uptake outer membrane protein n=1 Tax=Reichenbachiella sp. MALMAid0571 TaxID=3143939 RepID=UPI0032DF627D